MIARVGDRGVEPAYAIDRDKGAMCCDVYLFRNLRTYPLLDGGKEYDIDVRCMPGVVWHVGLEADIRRRWSDWWLAAGGEKINVSEKRAT